MPAKRPASRSPDGPRQSKRPLNGNYSPEEGEVDDTAPPASNPIIAPISLPQKPPAKTAVPFPFKKKEPMLARDNVFAKYEEETSKRQKEEPRKVAPRPPRRPLPGEGLEPMAPVSDQPPSLLSRLGPLASSAERDTTYTSHSARRSRSPASDYSNKHRLPPSNRSYGRSPISRNRGFDEDYDRDRDRDRDRGRDWEWEKARDRDRDRDRYTAGDPWRHGRDDDRSYRPDNHRHDYDHRPIRNWSRSRSRERHRDWRDRSRSRTPARSNGYDHRPRRSASPPAHHPRAITSHFSPIRRPLESPRPYNHPATPPNPDSLPAAKPATPALPSVVLRSPTPQPPSVPPPPPPPRAPLDDLGPRPPSSTPPPAPPPDTRLLKGLPSLPSIPSSLKIDSRRPEPPKAPHDVHSPVPLEKIARPTDWARDNFPSSYPPSAPGSVAHQQQQQRPQAKQQASQKPRLPPLSRPRPVKGKLPMRRPDKIEQQSYGHGFVGCGSQSDYEATTKLGEGTFGEVHKAIHKNTKAVVALKRILMHNEKEGMPVTALREIKILKALKHPCIVDILDMFVVRSTDKDPLSVYMVFPYMDHDLAGLLENDRVKLSHSHIKLYMKQLLEGTEYMHRNHILHRDMKAANLLISNDGRLRIADFGLARSFDELTANGFPLPAGNRKDRERKYTNCVVTRWYRPPELLLGSRHYGGEVDIWGIGCVLGEMFFRKPILPGTSDLDQLEKIWGLCGTPNQQNWPNHDRLPGCEGVRWTQPQSNKIRTVFTEIGEQTPELLEKLLTINPKERITAAQALEHDYFWTDPLPADPKTMPSYEASHEYDKRGHRQHVQPMNVPNNGQIPRHPGAGGPHQYPQQQQQQHRGGGRPPPGTGDGVQPFFVNNDLRPRGPPPGMPPVPPSHMFPPQHAGMPPPHMHAQGMQGMPPAPHMIPHDMPPYGASMPHPQMMGPYQGGLPPGMPPPGVYPPPGGGYGGRPPNINGGGGPYRSGGGGGGGGTRMPDNYNNFQPRGGPQGGSSGRYNNDRRDYHNGPRNHDSYRPQQSSSLPPPVPGLPPRPAVDPPPLNRDDRERGRYDRNPGGRYDPNRGGHSGGNGGGHNDRRPDYPPPPPPEERDQPDTVLSYGD